MKYTKEKYIEDCQKAKQEYQDAVVADAMIYFNKLNHFQTKRAEAIRESLTSSARSPTGKETAQ